MHRIAWSNGFRRGFKKATRNNPVSQEKIFHILEKLAHEPFDPTLKTHKLHGKLSGLWAAPSSMTAVLYSLLKECRMTTTISLFLRISESMMRYINWHEGC